MLEMTFRYGSAWLKPQQLYSGGRRGSGAKSSLCTKQVQGQSGPHKSLSQKGERKQKKKKKKGLEESGKMASACPQVTLLGSGCGKQTLGHISGHKVTTVKAVCGHSPCFPCLEAKAWLSCCQSARGKPFWPLWFWTRFLRRF